MEQCSFCGRSKKEVNRFFKGQSGLICEACVRLCSKALLKEGKTHKGHVPGHFLPMKDIPKPRDMKHKLDAFIIGQERAKKQLSVSVYNHYKRVLANQKDAGIELEKSNVLDRK